MHKLLLPLMLAAVWPALAFAQVPPGAPAYAAAEARNGYQPETLTLAGFLERVSLHNPELAAAAAEARAHDGAVRQAAVVPNPELATMLEDREKSTRTSTVQLNQRLELGGKRAGRVRAAEREREAALADLAVRRAEVRADAVTAFYDVLAQQERHRLALESVALAGRAAGAAARRVAAGKVSPVEETKARVAESAVRIELMQATSDLSAARMRLAVLGGKGSNLIGVAGSLESPAPPPPLRQLEQMLDSSPVLARARIEVERREAQSQLEKARRHPDLTVSLGAKRDEALGRSQAIIGLSVPLPLFDRNQGNVQEALARTDRARDEFVATEHRIAAELRQAHARLESAREQLELIRTDILPGAQSAYDAAQKGFEFGKFNFLDVLDAQRTLLQATSQYVLTLMEAHRASAGIERILGANWADRSAGSSIAKP